MSKTAYQPKGPASPGRVTPEELAAKLEATVERAGQAIAQSKARRSTEHTEHEQWRERMKQHRDEMERRRLARTDVHGVRLGKFRAGQFFPFDTDKETGK